VQAENGFEGVVEGCWVASPKLIQNATQDVTLSVPHRLFPLHLSLPFIEQEGYIGYEYSIGGGWETVTRCQEKW
jgi:hypothetical protein